jgi:sugar phosphate isomerase/epimerase
MASDDAVERFALAASIVPYNFAGWSPDDFIDSIARMGLNGVEMHAPPQWGERRGTVLRERLVDAGLDPLSSKYLTGGVGIDVVPSTLALEGDALGRALEAYRRECDVATDAGFPSMVVFAGLRRANPADRESELAITGRALGRVAAIARDRGLTVLLETHAQSIGYDHVSFLELRGWSEAENLLANVDPSNYAAVRVDVVEAISELGRLVGGVHVKDMLAGTEDEPLWAPPGAGVTNWTAVIDALRRTGYRGPLVIEYEAGITGAFPVDPDRGTRVSAAHIVGILEGAQNDY